jgi:methylmalonyl-CoA/ethylmalonyl-CoA epimerase
LLQATSEASAIHSFIEKRGEGIHHIAYNVKNIESEMVRLKSEGFRLLNAFPKKGADNKLICFVHPKDASGVLTELCQEVSK